MKSPLPRWSAGLLSIAFIAGLAACKDPNEVDQLSAVFADTLTAYALNGTPPSFPSAYRSITGSVTRADGNFSFDIAFDIDASNKVVVYPQRFVGVPCIADALFCGGTLAAKPVGLLRLTVPFDSLGRAPGAGYKFDSTFVVSPGDGLVMQVQDANDCSLFISTVHYTKLVVDSIDAARRAVFFRTVHNPNCGYRSLVAGVVPKN
jgi:hypothetical protein